MSILLILGRINHLVEHHFAPVSSLQKNNPTVDENGQQENNTHIMDRNYASVSAATLCYFNPILYLYCAASLTDFIAN